MEEEYRRKILELKLRCFSLEDEKHKILYDTVSIAMIIHLSLHVFYFIYIPKIDYVVFTAFIIASYFFSNLEKEMLNTYKKRKSTFI